MDINIFFYFMPLIMLSYTELLSKNSNVRIICFYLSSFLTLFFIGLGYKLGVDWVEYIKIYEGNSTQAYDYEVGYVAISSFFNWLGLPFWTFHIAIKLTYIFLVLKYIKANSLLPVLTLTIFFCMVFPFVNDPLRQLIAGGIFYVILIFYKRAPSFFWVAAGMLFHTSFVFVGTTFLRKVKLQQIVFLLLSMASVLILLIYNIGLLDFLSIPSVSGVVYKVKYYLDYTTTSNMLSSFIRIIFLFYICFSQTNRKLNIHLLGRDVYKCFWLFSFTYLSVEIISLIFPILAQRLRLYFIIFPLILFSNQIYLYKNKLNAFLLSCIIFSYCTLSLYLFIIKDIGKFYTLDNNIVIQYLTDYPKKDSAYSVEQYWLKK